jgi:adenosylmethionine-8-amino-7-oxononanoate aminotransferase
MNTSPHRYPESPVFYRALDRELPLIVRGKGVFLYDEHGRDYLDACGGAYVANVGHGVTEIADAVGEQLRRVAYVNGTAFTSEPVEALSAELRELSPESLDYAWFLSSGSEAVEAALKLARQYHVETGQPGRHKIISRTPGYHGNTLLALSASAREHYKKMYGPWLVPVHLIGAPYRSAAPRRALRSHPPAIGSTSARSATATASCSSPTRSSRAPAARAAGPRSSTSASSRTS